jgi:hypothetical protein
MQHTNSNIEIKESLLKGLEFNRREAKEYSHETVLNVMEEYASQFQHPAPTSGEDAVRFAEWVSNNQFTMYNNEWVSTKIHYSGCSYTTDELYTEYLNHK